jgi:hypothetical protein
MAPKTNLLLEALSDVDRRALQPYLTTADQAQHAVLFDVHDTIAPSIFRPTPSCCHPAVER